MALATWTRRHGQEGADARESSTYSPIASSDEWLNTAPEAAPGQGPRWRHRFLLVLARHRGPERAETEVMRRYSAGSRGTSFVVEAPSKGARSRTGTGIPVRSFRPACSCWRRPLRRRWRLWTRYSLSRA